MSLHAKLVWQTFNCTTFKDYHDIYLKCDAVLLTDFLEKFRETCLTNYDLDAAHYFSAPAMAWDAALKLTKVELDLFDNEEIQKNCIPTTPTIRSLRNPLQSTSRFYHHYNKK